MNLKIQSFIISLALLPTPPLAASITVTRVERSIASVDRAYENGFTPGDHHPFTLVSSTLPGVFSEELVGSVASLPATAGFRSHQISDISLNDEMLQVISIGGSESTASNGGNGGFSADAQAWSNLNVDFTFSTEFVFTLDVLTSASQNGLTAPRMWVGLASGGNLIYQFGTNPQRPEETLAASGNVEATLPAGTYQFFAYSDARSLSGGGNPNALDHPSSSYELELTATSVPEPQACLLMLVGAAVGLLRRRASIPARRGSA